MFRPISGLMISCFVKSHCYLLNKCLLLILIWYCISWFGYTMDMCTCANVFMYIHVYFMFWFVIESLCTFFIIGDQHCGCNTNIVYILDNLNAIITSNWNLSSQQKLCTLFVCLILNYDFPINSCLIKVPYHCGLFMMSRYKTL